MDHDGAGNALVRPILVNASGAIREPEMFTIDPQHASAQISGRSNVVRIGVTRTRKSVLSITGVCLLCVAAWLAWGARRVTDDEGAGRAGRVERSGDSGEIRPRDRAGRSGAKAHGGTKLSEERFAQLKRELAEHSASCTGWISPEFESFIDRLLAELQFSPEMLEILVLIEDPKYWHAKRGIDQALKERLQDPEGTAVRRSLVEVAGDSKWSDFAAKLCWYAGEACSKEELDDLTLLSSDPVVGRDLELGYNLSLAGTDPVAAVESTIAYCKVPRSGASTILNQIFDRLPPGTDFAAVDALLPPSREQKDDAHFRHAQLLQAWGGVDPEAAANHIVDHPDRFPPEMMVYVVAPYVREHPQDALDWVREFPAGPYFDAAASAVVDQFADTHFDVASELAAKIGDPEIRRKALEMIENFKSGARG